MKKKITLFALFCWLFSFQMNAQIQNDDGNPPTQNDQDILEMMMSGDGGDVDINTAFEPLEPLIAKPLNLNKIDYEDFKPLLEAGLLTELQARSILDYREKLGDFIVEYELQAVPNLDLQTIQNLLTYTKIKGAIDDYQVPLLDLATKGKNELFLRWGRFLETQEGFLPTDDPTKNRYLGSPDRLYVRFKHSYENKFMYGFTAEKDAGEEFFKGTQKQGFDYYSGFLFASKLNKTVQALAIGDFEARFGQGLILWSGLAYGKSADVMNIKRTARPLKQYSSVNEALFMRGAGITLNLNKHLSLTTFGSYRFRDGNLQDSTIVDDAGASALLLSGLHRTQAEVADKNTVSHIMGGASLKFRKQGFQIAANGVYNRLSESLNPNFDVYNQFRFAGNQLINASIDYSYIYKNYNFFGETAVSDNGGIATVNGLLLGLDRMVSMSVLHRHYDRSYQVLQGAGFGEGRNTNNENGLFMGLRISPKREWIVAGYFDLFKRNWLIAQTDAPSIGHEYLFQITHRPVRGTEIYFRYRSENKEENASNNETQLNYIVPIRRQNLRLHFSHKLSKAVEIRSRAELVLFNDGVEKKTTKGFLIYQDILLKPILFPLQFTGRIAVFNTDNYDTRVYAFENDILYSSSVPALYNRGTRMYLTARYRPIKALTLEGRIAQTYYANEKTFGSGLDEIQAPHRTEVRFQARISF